MGLTEGKSEVLAGLCSPGSATVGGGESVSLAFSSFWNQAVSLGPGPSSMFNANSVASFFKNTF